MAAAVAGPVLEQPPRPDRAIAPDTIPDELKALHQWVVWRRVLKDGKPTKKPFNARTGQPASTSEPNTWCSLSEALAAASEYDGIGFVLTVQDPFVGADLDHCVSSAGVPDPWAMAVVQRLNTYSEFSPSGNGIRILGRGKLPAGRRKLGHFEIYDSGRFLTLTGWHLEGSPVTIEERADEIVTLHEEKFGTPIEPTSGRRNQCSSRDPRRTRTVAKFHLFSKRTAA